MAKAAKISEVFLSKPVREVLGQAFGELEAKAEDIGKRYADAADTGSAHHENGPGEFWREEKMKADGKVQELRQIYNAAKVYEPPSNHQDRVQLGSGVRVTAIFPESDAAETSYTLVSPADLKVCDKLSVRYPNSWISTATPIGAALINKGVNDKDITASVPDGQVRLAIREIIPGDFHLTLPTRPQVQQKPS